MPQQVVEGLSDYISAICSLHAGWHPSKIFFFRGAQDIGHELKPSVFRRDYAESDLSHNFRASAFIEQGAPPHDELDRWLFIMQHHRLPTRLLDWTESALIALHFALHGNRLDTDAAVFVLDPTGLNEHVLGQRWFPDRNDPNYRYRFLKAFYRHPSRLPWATGVELDKVPNLDLPLAVRPILTHKRMISQQACFTVHGDDHRSLEAIFAAHKKSELLRTIVIPSAAKKAMGIDLKRIGLTRSIVFPDLEGVAEDLVSRTKIEME
jgi:hypothetical protein